MKTIVALAAFAAAIAVDARAEGPVVVELFASQGRHSCPPADDALGALKENPDVLPLALHVTYWDRLGWPDSFGRAEDDARQQAYAHAMGSWRVYIPQAVVGGVLDVVGSHRARLDEAIALWADKGPSGPTFELARDGDVLEARLGAGEGAPATVMLVGYKKVETVDVERGDNAGKRLTYHNIFHRLERLGAFDGEPATYEATLDPALEWAVFLQRDQDRAIVSSVLIL